MSIDNGEFLLSLVHADGEFSDVDPVGWTDFDVSDDVLTVKFEDDENDSISGSWKLTRID